MERNLRRFNHDGLREFDAGLGLLAAGVGFSAESLLVDEDLTEPLESSLVAEPKFVDRYDMAMYLVPVVQDSGLKNPMEDRGLWSWVAAAWLEPLLGDTATTKLGHTQRWLLRTNAWQSYYRHLFAGPCAIVAQHQDDPIRCRVLLTGSVLQPGGFYDDAASQQRNVRSKGLLEAMTSIYLDEGGKLIPGSAGHGGRAGSMRRLARHLDRLELTYDLQSISAAALLDVDQAILPDEFRSFS